MKTLLFVFTIVAVFFSSKVPENGKELLTKMHETYAGKWYKTFKANEEMNPQIFCTENFIKTSEQ